MRGDNYFNPPVIQIIMNLNEWKKKFWLLMWCAEWSEKPSYYITMIMTRGFVPVKCCGCGWGDPDRPWWKNWIRIRPLQKIGSRSEHDEKIGSRSNHGEKIGYVFNPGKKPDPDPNMAKKLDPDPNMVKKSDPYLTLVKNRIQIRPWWKNRIRIWPSWKIERTVKKSGSTPLQSYVGSVYQANDAIQ